MFHKLARIRDRGLRVAAAIDAGAADGAWMASFKEVYPDASLLCIEPREEALASLRERAGRWKGVVVAQALLADRAARATFYEQGKQSSVLACSDERMTGAGSARVTTTLDALVEHNQLLLPDLIKLDLQGAELLALRGAPRCLEHAQALLLEASFLPLYRGSPLLAEVTSFLDARGFACYDILALWHRPVDLALAQGDFLYLRKDHPLRADLRWAADGRW